MKKWILGLAALLVSGTALAHGHARVFLGFNFGFPAYYPAPYYYYPAPVYYPPPIIVQQQPPVYTERQEPAPAPQSFWYYCSASQAYYPYVKECPAGWQKVPAAPAN